MNSDLITINLNSVTIIILAITVILMTINIRNLSKKIVILEKVLLMARSDDFLKRIELEKRNVENAFKLSNKKEQESKTEVE